MPTAPAKLNLSLRIHRKRDDGFHELTTLMAPLRLADRMNFEPADKFELHCDAPGVPTDESNLVTRALRSLEEALGRELPYRITLEKRVPHGAGLGGGSSDAATTLREINRHEGCPLGLAELSTLAARLGSDVPFFLHQSLCECGGRGETISPLPQAAPNWPILLIKPCFGVATPDAYRRWQSSREIQGIPYQPQEIDGFVLVNDLERPVFEKHRFLAEAKLWLLQQPETRAALMSGSGSTLFAVLREASAAKGLAERARQQLDPTLWTHATTFSIPEPSSAV